MRCLESIKFVCSVDLQVAANELLDIRHIARFGFNTEMKYNSKWVTMRSKKLGATATIYKSGKLICVGGHTRMHAKKLTRQMSRLVQKLNNPDIKFRRFSVINIVSTIDIGKDINLEKFAIKNRFTTFYEPELHPWAVCYMSQPNKLTFHVFPSGKIIIHDIKNLNDLREGLLKLKDILN